MARRDNLDHDGFMTRRGPRGARAENVAYGCKDSPCVIQQWVRSSGHRKNMLDPDVTDTGVAVARSEKTGRYYAVQMFGRPKSAAVKFSVANESGEAVTYEVGGESFELPPDAGSTHLEPLTW